MTYCNLSQASREGNKRILKPQTAPRGSLQEAENNYQVLQRKRPKSDSAEVNNSAEAGTGTA